MRPLLFALCLFLGACCCKATQSSQGPSASASAKPSGPPDPPPMSDWVYKLAEVGENPQKHGGKETSGSSGANQTFDVLVSGLGTVHVTRAKANKKAWSIDVDDCKCVPEQLAPMARVRYLSPVKMPNGNAVRTNFLVTAGPLAGVFGYQNTGSQALHLLSDDYVASNKLTDIFH